MRVMKDPKLSIIVPSYSHAPYLSRRLDSLLNQTFQDFELIIIDDCSPDSSREIIERYRYDPRVRIVYHEQNQGVNRTINEGMDLAQGEYLHIAESDDWCEPSLLEKSCKVLDEHPQVGMVHCQLRIVNAENRVLSLYHDRYLPDLHYTNDYIASGVSEFRRAMKRGNAFANCSGIVFRRSCYLTLGGRDDRLRLTADWYMWLRICLYWDVAFIAEPLAYFRVHERTVRHDVSKVRQEELENVRVVIAELIPQAPVSEVERRELWQSGKAYLRLRIRSILATDFCSSNLPAIWHAFWLGVGSNPWMTFEELLKAILKRFFRLLKILFRSTASSQPHP
jgi:glycosyltransferase involved in cell wall biosynthesis